MDEDVRIAAVRQYLAAPFRLGKVAAQYVYLYAVFVAQALRALSLRATKVRLTPSLARSWAQLLPIPWLAPQTRACLPAICRSMASSSKGIDKSIIL
jgi:hypothetical protein